MLTAILSSYDEWTNGYNLIRIFIYILLNE